MRSVKGAGRECSGRSSYFVVLCLTIFSPQLFRYRVDPSVVYLAYDYLKYVHHWEILTANSGIKWDSVTHSSVMLLPTFPLCPVMLYSSKAAP